MRTKWIDFNNLLQLANLCVAGLLVFALVEMADNEYVDRNTLALGLLLCAQTCLALLVESRRRDPFVILLTFAMVFYYEFRIFTLTVYPFSAVFDRYEFDAADSNYALIFILIANLFLYAGFYAVRQRQERQRANSENWEGTSPLSVVSLLVVAIVFAYFKGSYWTADNIPRVFNFLVTFLDPGFTILMALSYYWLFRKSLSTGFAFAIGMLIAADIVAHTLWGSRSAIVFFVQNCMFVALAIGGCIQVRKKFVVLGVILMPVLVGLLVVSFVVSTYNRALKAGAVSLDVGKSLQSAAESGSSLLTGPNFDIVLPPIAARAGFFDFAAEIIAHREEYSPVVNVVSYGKSVIDNILTPGFDVFDQPKISNALQFVYKDWGVPLKSQVSEYYQSDQFCVYGEFYALLGYLSLPLLFLTAFMLKLIYVRISNPNPFLFTMQRVVVLYVWARLIDSFGMDWIIPEVIPLIASLYLYAFFFRSRYRGDRNSELLPGASSPRASRVHRSVEML